MLSGSLDTHTARSDPDLALRVLCLLWRLLVRENFSHEETKLSCDFSRASVLFSIHKNLSSYEDSTFMIISNSGPSCNLVYGNTIHSLNPRESPRIGDSPYETAIETIE